MESQRKYRVRQKNPSLRWSAVTFPILEQSSNILRHDMTQNLFDSSKAVIFTGSTSPCDRVLFKLAVTVHRCLNGRAPPTVPVGLLRPCRQCWHSTASAFRQPSTTCYQLNTYGCHAFSVVGPRSGTLSRISSGTRPSVQTVSDVCS